MDWESKLLSDLEAGCLRPRTHGVVRRLAEHQTSVGDLGKKVVAAFDRGEGSDDERLLHEVWKRIETLPLVKQGGLRTLVALLRPDEPVDGHLAEYLIGWAQDDGICPSIIEAAFR